MMNCIDLHLHLDGAITPAIARKLAEKQHIALPAETDEEMRKLIVAPPEYTSLTEFLNCFALPCSLMQTPEGLSEAVYLVQESLKEQGLLYAELRFAPQLHTEKGMTQEDAVLAALEGLRRSSFKSNLILCCMRGADTKEKNRETLRLCEKYLTEDGGVAAMDLAGAEAIFPTSDYKDLFLEAARRDIPFTIHAGEADGPDSIRAALDCNPRRIGHGVRIIEDPSLIDRVLEMGVTLEMCPTSNRLTHAIPDQSKYPLRELLQKGVRVTLNTDDPAIEDITLAHEYTYMQDAFGLTPKEELQLLENAINASFSSESFKNEIRINRFR